MPEQRETASSGKVAEQGIKKALDAEADLAVEGIYADASAAEAKRDDAPERAQSGLVYELHFSSPVVRGSKSHQTPIYPEVMKEAMEKVPVDVNYPPLPYPPTLRSLVLTGVQATHRALILNFGMLHLMVSYLTHTSVQWYTRLRWDNGIMCVTHGVRKFHVGMALVFKEYVLAFVTIDLLFQPIWKQFARDFNIPPDIYTDTVNFLVLLSNWITDENWLDGKRYVLACDAIRGANKMFYGIGVYTVMELFFLAGLSPFITACELFGSPSRTARFLAAYYSYIHVGETGLARLINPCIHEGVLAPTTEQRLRYTDWLYVWGKERVYMSTRMGQLLDSYHSILEKFSTASDVTRRDDVADLFDVFEPTLVAPALEAHPTWGSLIFGEGGWRSLSGDDPMSTDPLTEFYRQHGLLSDPTHLRSAEFYSPLFLESSDLKRARRDTFTYHGKKEMWSVFRKFPATLHWSSNPNHHSQIPRIDEISGSARQSMLFKSKVLNSQGVSIGPLEYCGNGHIVTIGTSSFMAVCKGDPWVPQHLEERVLRGLDRISAKLEATGSHKRKRTEKENKALNKKLSTLNAGYARAAQGAQGKEKVEAEENVVAPKPKKRRLNADQRLALQSI